MGLKVIKLYTAVTTTTNAAITYQFPQRQRLDAIFAAIAMTSTNGSQARNQYEFSLQSTAQATTNDAVGIVAVIEAGTDILAAVAKSERTNALVTPIGFTFEAGDRLYVNVTSAGASAALATFVLYCS